MNHYYNKELKMYSRELRNNSVSRAEKYIWKALLSNKKMGFRCKRQRPIDQFIVDFLLQDLCLIIEIDGNSHRNKGEYDVYRENRLKSLGFEIMRFAEGDVLNNLSAVKEKIDHAIYCLKLKK